MNKRKYAVITVAILIGTISATIAIGKTIGSSDTIIAAIVAAQVGIASLVFTIMAKKKGRSVIIKGEEVKAKVISAGSYLENVNSPTTDKKSMTSDIQVSGNKINVDIIASGDVVKNKKKD